MIHHTCEKTWLNTNSTGKEHLKHKLIAAGNFQACIKTIFLPTQTDKVHPLVDRQAGKELFGESTTDKDNANMKAEQVAM